MLATTDYLWNTQKLVKMGNLHPRPLIQVDSNSALIDKWLSGKPTHTQRGYRRDAEYFLAFANNKPVPAITLDDLIAYGEALRNTVTQSRCGQPRPLAPNTITRRCNGVRSLLGFAEKKRIIIENPAKYWDEKTGYTDKRSERILSESQILCMIALEPSNRNKILLRFFYDIGLRISELCDLRWKHLRDAGNGDGLASIYGKGGKKRDVRFHSSLWQQLRSVRGSAGLDDPLFLGRGGKPLSQSRIRAIILEAAQRAGLQHRVTPHWLRHCNATHGINRGAPVSLIQANHGHSDLSITTRYIHANPADSVSFYLTR